MIKLKSNRERIAIVDGLRTPMSKAGGVFKDVEADELGSKLFRELLMRLPFEMNLFDEIIIGNVAQPSHAANIARVIAIYAGLSRDVPAFTVHRNCASGMEAIAQAMLKIRAGEGDVYLVGGVESMSNIPLLFNKKMTSFFERLSKSKSIFQKLATVGSFRLSNLAPIIGIVNGLTDPTCNLIMGKTAENIAKDFKISRKEQDAFAMRSHNLAEYATKNGIFAQESMSMYSGQVSKMIDSDDGIRDGQSMDALGKLKPYFDKPHGTVTVGNSSQITDGACGLVLMSETKAKEMKLKPIGYVKDFAFAGCDQTRMGLGPIFSTSKLLDKTGDKLSDFDLIELNEAFAAQAIGCMLGFGSQEFFNKHLGGKNAIGSVDFDIVNVNGGAIALGHPVGMTGARLVLHLAKELRRKNKNKGLATLCIGGGQGCSMIVEAE